jgi:ABC-type glycerol-3-phosphate transport system substrate-binding protein
VRRSSTVVTVVLALIVVFSAVACGAQHVIEYMYLAGVEATEQARAESVAVFEAANPDIKVERIRVQSNYRDRLIALIAAGTVPDVLSLDMQDIMSFADDRFLHDLRPLAEKTPSFQFERLAPPIVDVYTVGGKIYALPITANPSVYAYNMDLFDHAGLPYPYDLYRKDAWTWDAFRDMARKINRRGVDGRTEIVGAVLHLPRTWLYANGGGEFDDVKRPTEIFYDSEVGLETVQFLHSLIWEDSAMLYTSHVRQNIGATDVVGFTQGKVGMTTRWFSYVPDFSQAPSKIGLVPYPKGPRPGGRYATDLGSFGIAISQTTRDLDAAWRFVAYNAGPAGAVEEAKLPGRTPARPVPLAWLSSSVVNPEVYFDILMQTTSRVLSINRLDLQRIIDTELNAVWNNQVEPRTAVSEISRRIRAYLKENPQ